MANQRTARRNPGYPLILGVNRLANGYNFAVEAPEDAEVSLLLYYRKAKKPSEEILLTEKYRTGRIFSVLLPDFQPGDYEYNFKINGKIETDPCAYRISGSEHFGAPRDMEDVHKLRCGFLPEEPFLWEEGEAAVPDYEDMVLYKLHVRGYTRQSRLVKGKKGTFLGLTEMIPYWKELGINAIELMPAYEFEEVSPAEEPEGLISTRRQEEQVNYWGYLPGYYFAPKRSYCATKEPEKEFCTLVQALHKAGIACIMEVFFPEKTGPLLALRALQFWKRYYHVDGFHLIGGGVPLDLILRDGVLAGTKIMADGYDMSRLAGDKKISGRTFGEYNQGFLQDMRRFLKSDEDMVPGVQYRIRRNPGEHAVINYMACQDGFTLHDMVSYTYKHNEENGENNQDGSSYNYSWNCGVEGPSRKLAVRQMREKQMRNAFAMVLFSQGVPMIYGGDEIANSQGGNNNAYCQDNPVGWVDWKGLKKNEGLCRFVKKAIAFRKAHPMLGGKKELKESDYMAKGFPDISFHGERAWFCNSENTSRMLGIMYCGGYAEKADGTADDFIYIAYNFHWENRTFALPNLPSGMSWEKTVDTGDLAGDGFYEDSREKYKKEIEISPRTIVVLLGKQEEKKDAPVASLQNHHKA